MVTITVEATYEGGVLKPAQPLPIKERETVEIVIHTPAWTSSQPLARPDSAERKQALERLFSLRLPVGDWHQMEDEIIRGAVE